MTTAALGREAFVRMLDASRDMTSAGERHLGPLGAKKQFTVRMYCSDIDRLIAHARAVGASYGSYVSALLDGAPPPLIIDPQQVISTLARSTDRLTAIASDLNELMRVVRRGAVPTVRDCGQPVEELTRLIRPHLESASQLMVELMPARPRRFARRRARTEQSMS